MTNANISAGASSPSCAADGSRRPSAVPALSRASGATGDVLQEPGGWAEVYRKQLEESKAPAETLQQMNEIMQSPEMLGMMMVLVLLIFFVLITLPMVVGGAVAAKAMERD